MLQINQHVLFYNFIKSNFENYSINAPENVILALSSDIEFKISEIAKLSRNIMLKAKRNYCRNEDVKSALRLTFSNILLVDFNFAEISDKCADTRRISVRVLNDSVPILSGKIFELNAQGKRVYTHLIKSIFDRDYDTFKFVLSTVRQKSCLNEVLSAIICTLNEKIDIIQGDEAFMRIVLLLENMMVKKSLSLSENPLRDICISVLLKLLWSVNDFNIKLRVSQILQALIDRQYLLQHTIKKMIIDKLLNEFNQPFLTCFCYGGCLIGLVTLGYTPLMFTDEFISNLYTLPEIIKESTSVKEAICYFLNKMNLDQSLYSSSYSKFQYLVDMFFGLDFIINFMNPSCFKKYENCDSDNSNSKITSTVPSVSVLPYSLLTREIDVLLHGGTVDDLKSSNFEMDDDMPPILFRKSSIQTHLVSNRYSVEDIGFFRKPLIVNRPIISFNINNVTPSQENVSESKKGFDSEFYNVFHRRHQYIVNSESIRLSRVTSNCNKKNRKNSCVMYNLFYVL